MYFTVVEDANGIAVDVSMWVWAKFVEQSSGENVQAVVAPEQVRLLSVDGELVAQNGEMLVMRADGGIEVMSSKRFKTQFVSLEMRA